MSQNRGFTRGFVAIERFLILMIYIFGGCRYSEVSQLGVSTVFLTGLRGVISVPTYLRTASLISFPQTAFPKPFTQDFISIILPKS